MQINKTYPIKLSELESIIDRIHQQYDLISKADIAIIVKHFFEELRFLILSDKEININNYFPSIKLVKYKVKEKDAIKVKTTTPKRIRNL